MSGDDVNFVLVYTGFLSSGMSEWVTGPSGSGPETRWGFEGHVYLVDKDKTRQQERTWTCERSL